MKHRTQSNTKWARRAIAEFVESNLPRFNGWLEQIAGGIPQYDRDGEIQYDSKGVPQWLVKPDPALAMKLVTDIAEYHLPKLSRSEATVVAKVESNDLSNMSTMELQRQIMVRLGLTADVIEGEVEAEPVEVPRGEPLP